MERERTDNTNEFVEDILCVSKEGQEVTGSFFGIKLLPWRG